MSDSENIESILWHEIGHLVIDILLVDKHPDLSIKELVIRNYDCQNINWCGWVKLEPEASLAYDEVVKNNSLIAFKFLSLYSGCLLQSLHAPDKVKVSDCFAFKQTAIGKGDHDQSSKLMSELIKNNEVLRGNMKFFKTHYSIINDKLKAVFLANDCLKKHLSPIINAETKKILDDIKANNDVAKYNYKYKDSTLLGLTKTVNQVIIECKLKDQVEGLVDEIVENLEVSITK